MSPKYLFFLTSYLFTAMLMTACSNENVPAPVTAEITGPTQTPVSDDAAVLSVSKNKVIVNTPEVDIDIKRDNVPYVDFPAPEISIPSVNSISPDISILLPEGVSFDELFENAGEVTSSSGNFSVSIAPDTITEIMPLSPPRPKTALKLYYKMSDYKYNGSALHGACTPMTMINCLNKFNNDGDCTLTETLDIASRLGLWTASGGMSAEGIFITTAALNELHNTGNSVALFAPKDCDELGEIIDRGLTAGVCVDSNMLWKGTGDGYADHMIAVLKTDRDKTGLLKGFEIIDSGMGMTYISADLYDECALGNKLGFAMIFGNSANPPY
ncbi:MAG: hypothetical protein J6P45_02245 [Lachnospiraceae bacterium]|nr:hypothetical protein [Lachnospiraceae bacterium]